jgi:hypothetical protein
MLRGAKLLLDMSKVKDFQDHMSSCLDQILDNLLHKQTLQSLMLRATD